MVTFTDYFTICVDFKTQSVISEHMGISCFLQSNSYADKVQFWSDNYI